MSPISWWSTYEPETPELAEIAVKVLSQLISSSSAERIWSSYSYIYNVKRKRLNSVRAIKLVYVHSNIRLISRFTKNYNDGPYRKWDINPEVTYLDDSATRLEELRWRKALKRKTQHKHLKERSTEEVKISLSRLEFKSLSSSLCMSHDSNF